MGSCEFIPSVVRALVAEEAGAATGQARFVGSSSGIAFTPRGLMMRAMNRLLPLLLLVSLTAPLWSEPKPAPPHKTWEKTIAAFEAEDKQTPPPKGAVLFIGASGITRWKTLKEDFPKYTVINRGFGGSQVDDAVYYADRIVIPYQPKTIVFQSGGNDLNAGKSPEKVAKDFEAFVGKVRAALPDVRILFIESPPSTKRWDQRDKQQQYNKLVKQFLESGTNMVFIPLWDPFIGADGKPNDALYVEDHLHNNAEGYKIRARIVNEYLDRK